MSAFGVASAARYGVAVWVAAEGSIRQRFVGTITRHSRAAVVAAVVLLGGGGVVAASCTCAIPGVATTPSPSATLSVGGSVPAGLRTGGG